jgi:hypothetical protein
MQSPIRDSLRLLVLATALAGSLPGTAAAGGVTSKASTDASCKVPAEGELRLPAAPPASLGPAVHGLAGEARQARAEGIQPLNSRGHNYDSGRTGMDAAALDFESGAR